MSDYVYMRSKPSEITFKLRFSDDSGDKLIVFLGGKQQDIMIKDVGSSVVVNIEDVEWLRQALKDAYDISQMNKIEEKQRSS